MVLKVAYGTAYSGVIQALVAGIHLSANATAANRWRRAKLPAKAFAEIWILGTRPGMTAGNEAILPAAWRLAS